MKELHGAEKKVFETEGDFYCLIETGGSNSDHDEEVRLTNILSPRPTAVAATCALQLQTIVPAMETGYRSIRARLEAEFCDKY
jgi:hypothetical protein